jgi:hypothetical protein
MQPHLKPEGGLPLYPARREQLKHRTQPKRAGRSHCQVRQPRIDRRVGHLPPPWRNSVLELRCSFVLPKLQHFSMNK